MKGFGRVTWPAGLEELVFGDDFDQPLDGVAWPPGLRRVWLDYEWRVLGS